VFDAEARELARDTTPLAPQLGCNEARGWNAREIDSREN
jgi:hypothetical protein